MEYSRKYKDNIKKASDEEREKIVPDVNFYKIAKGFKDRRNIDIQKEKELTIQENAKYEATKKRDEDKRIKDMEAKNAFLSSAGYIEDFKLTKSLVAYSLKRVGMRIQNELNKMEALGIRIKNKEVIPDSEMNSALRPIALTKAEIGQLRAYKTLFETARTALKMPIRYNSNIEDDKGQSSIGDVLAIMMEYEKQGGSIVDENNDSILDNPAVFDRNKL